MSYSYFVLSLLGKQNGRKVRPKTAKHANPRQKPRKGLKPPVEIKVEVAKEAEKKDTYKYYEVWAPSKEYYYRVKKWWIFLRNVDLTQVPNESHFVFSHIALRQKRFAQPASKTLTLSALHLGIHHTPSDNRILVFDKWPNISSAFEVVDYWGIP